MFANCYTLFLIYFLLYFTNKFFDNDADDDVFKFLYFIAFMMLALVDDYRCVVYM